MYRIAIITLSTLILTGCSLFDTIVKKPAATAKSVTCWKIIGWQATTPPTNHPALGSEPMLLPMQCNAKSNHNYWVAVDFNNTIHAMVNKNDPYIDHYTQQEAGSNGPAGHYFWRYLRIVNGFTTPPVLVVDNIPSSNTSPLLTATSTECPIGPCLWID